VYDGPATHNSFQLVMGDATMRLSARNGSIKCDSIRLVAAKRSNCELMTALIVRPKFGGNGCNCIEDTIRDAVLTCCQKPTKVSLIYRSGGSVAEWLACWTQAH